MPCIHEQVGSSVGFLNRFSITVGAFLACLFCYTTKHAQRVDTKSSISTGLGRWYHLCGKRHFLLQFVTQEKIQRAPGWKQWFFSAFWPCCIAKSAVGQTKGACQLRIDLLLASIFKAVNPTLPGSCENSVVRVNLQYNLVPWKETEECCEKEV